MIIKCLTLNPIAMKRLKILARIVTLFFLFGCFNACEKDEVLQSDNDPAENELTATDELAVTDELALLEALDLRSISADISDDPLMAEELTSVDAISISMPGELVKYEYQRNRLVKMHYYRSVPAISTAAEQATRQYKTDEFFYANERLAGISRVFHMAAWDNAGRPPSIKKRFEYDRSGRLTDIYIKMVRGQSVITRHEILNYNNADQMVRKIIKGEDMFFTYRYDKNGRLVAEFKYSQKRLQQVTRFFYTEEDNVSHKVFYRPLPNTSSERISRRFIVKYDYEPGPNPFNWMKLPFGTLFPSMDEISNNNYIKIATPAKEVTFKYEYSLLTGFPVVRYTFR